MHFWGRVLNFGVKQGNFRFWQQEDYLDSKYHLDLEPSLCWLVTGPASCTKVWDTALA